MKLHPLIVKTLDETGLPWQITEGRRHYLILICGKRSGIIPKGAKGKEASQRIILNNVGYLKRAAKRIKEQKEQQECQVKSPASPPKRTKP